MPSDQQDILEILKTELDFIEKGGYGAPDKQESGVASTMFADSLTCLNYGYPYRVHPCGECPLMEFVPEDRRVSPMPCHHIPLDSSGQTVEAFEKTENQTQMQEAVKIWLRQTISQLESQRSA
jgi:hypothetical protein